MAEISISRRWPDEDQIVICIEVDDNHPDGLLSEAARVAVKTYAEALDVTIAADAIEPDETTDGL